MGLDGACAYVVVFESWKHRYNVVHPYELLRNEARVREIPMPELAAWSGCVVGSGRSVEWQTSGDTLEVHLQVGMSI